MLILAHSLTVSCQLTKHSSPMRAVSKSHTIQLFTSTEQESQCVNTFR